MKRETDRGLVTSARGGWDGALLVQGDAGPVRRGEARHAHQALVIQRWQTPNDARPIGGRGPWTTRSPGVRLFMPGERELGEWRGHPWSQLLFVAPERVQVVLGKPWSSSGLTRWREATHRLPFVEHVFSAMMEDIAAGHPAGPITGDALVIALLLYLDAGAAAADAAVGRRAIRVRPAGVTVRTSTPRSRPRRRGEP
jgi:hypothetical protein